MQVIVTELRKIFIPEIFFFNLLFKNINFKILINIVLSLVNQPLYFISYNNKSCYLSFLKFKIIFFIPSILNFHFTFLYNSVIHLFLFYSLPSLLSSSKILHIPSHKCSICFLSPHRFHFHNLSGPF